MGTRLTTPPPNVSYSIMAHPARANWVHELRRTHKAPPVGWDDEGPPSRDPDRIWRTARRAWLLYDPTADWHVVLQDDADPTPLLLVTLPEALRCAPRGAVVSLYLGSVRPMAGTWRRLAEGADAVGASWIVGPMIQWGVALAVRTGDIPGMIRWCDMQRGIPDDLRIGRWARKHKREAWYTWPSLVDHRDAGSLTGHGPGRVARRVGVSDRWDGPVVRYSAR